MGHLKAKLLLAVQPAWCLTGETLEFEVKAFTFVSIELYYWKYIFAIKGFQYYIGYNQINCLTQQLTNDVI